jgi:hypothetical protein
MALREIDGTQILRKRIVKDEPQLGDTSQYTFSATESNFTYGNSTSLPKNNDKFQDKDLNITVKGDLLNEKIIERNLKFDSNSFISIDRIFVENVGTLSELEDVRIKMWMFTDQYFNPKTNYSAISSKLNASDEDRIFEYKAGRLNNGDDLGNLTFVEGAKLIYNLENFDSNEQSTAEQEDFGNKTEGYSVKNMMLKREPFLEEGDLIDIEPAFITTTYHRVDNVAEWDEDISEGNIPPDTGFGNSNFPSFEQGAGLYNSGNSWIIMGAYKSEEDDDENKVPVAGGDWTLDMDEDNGDDPEETHSFLSFRQFQSNLFRENSSQTTHNDLKNLLKTEGTFDDYHMLVGSEVIKIRDHFVDDNYYPKLAMFKLLRGQGGTTAYGHVPGETVKLYAPDVSPEDIVAKEDATLLARTDLIDRNVFNPIYMLFELTAHAPSDKRDSRWQVMQINNLDCYDINNNRKSTTFQFDQMYSYETFGNESGGGIDDSALKITDMQVTVNTNTSTPNDWTVNSSKDDRNTYKQFFNFIKCIT